EIFAYKGVCSNGSIKPGCSIARLNGRRSGFTVATVEGEGVGSVDGVSAAGGVQPVDAPRITGTAAPTTNVRNCHRKPSNADRKPVKLMMLLLDFVQRVF